jgi:hypothetical protein
MQDTDGRMMSESDNTSYVTKALLQKSENQETFATD